MAIFEMKTKVLFQHCDPAGIVFYPRYYEMVNAVVETFFDEAVGWSFARMHAEDGMGVPMGRITTEFEKASRLGDVLDWTLQVKRIGTSSCDLRIAASGSGELRMTAEGTIVCVRLASMRAEPWQDDVRATLTTYMEGDA
ncbi:thioesterase family protein [Tropicimonas sp. IMCC34011]|uniref:acyl-CoA thioesterase n=1 Tax=Tropicimonas sp. IMCC34011 TaxID=2248759 RepID=UPI000E2684B7|nr:thioesterase family protein [Tropicimonas sp. IMCC34011]